MSYICICMIVFFFGLVTADSLLLLKASFWMAEDCVSALRWGIIGCGDVTEVKSGPGFQLAAGSKLVAVMRRDPEKARDYAERHGVPKWYSTVEEILKDQEVDAIYIATPPGSRVDIAEKVARSGRPCYLEKPMARNLTESQEIFHAFESRSIPLFVAYYRRSYPKFQRLKALLDSGKLGRISAVQYRLERSFVSSSGWRQEVSTSGGGLFVDLGSHILDLLDFLLGPLTMSEGLAVKGSDADESSPEDVVGISFGFGSPLQGIGTGLWNFKSTESCDLLEITTSKAKIILPECMNGTAVLVKGPDGSILEEWEELPPTTVQLPMIQTVSSAIASKNPALCPSSGESALRTASYINEALKAFYGGRSDDFWKRVDTWPSNKPAVP